MTARQRHRLSVIVIITLLGVAMSFAPAAAMTFDPAAEASPCAPGQSCIVIHQCDAYQTQEQILRLRPKPCGFSGLMPKVCCTRRLSNTGPIRILPPAECGKPRSTVIFVRFKRQAIPDLHSAPRSSEETFPDEPPVGAGVGGVDAIVGKWPWMVLFGRWTDTGLGDWFCGGVLITDRHVLTAAHCLRPEEAGAVGALIGDNDLTRQDEVTHQERNISSIVRHPQYVGAQNDLAVVRLAAPVQLTEDVSPICLPPPGAEHIGRDVEMAGWGLLEFAGNPSNILQEVALRVAEPAECETSYQRVPQFSSRFPGGFQGTKVCAESRDGESRDACRGDSGGPLMALLPNDTYELVGVVSTGVGCGNHEFPGLYTKVSAYIDWITSQLLP